MKTMQRLGKLTHRLRISVSHSPFPLEEGDTKMDSSSLVICTEPRCSWCNILAETTCLDYKSNRGGQ